MFKLIAVATCLTTLASAARPIKSDYRAEPKLERTTGNWCCDKRCNGACKEQYLCLGGFPTSANNAEDAMTNCKDALMFCCTTDCKECGDPTGMFGACGKDKPLKIKAQTAEAAKTAPQCNPKAAPAAATLPTPVQAASTSADTAAIVAKEPAAVEAEGDLSDFAEVEETAGGETNEVETIAETVEMPAVPPATKEVETIAETVEMPAAPPATKEVETTAETVEVPAAPTATKEVDNDPDNLFDDEVGTSSSEGTNPCEWCPRGYSSAGVAASSNAAPVDHDPDNLFDDQVGTASSEATPASAGSSPSAEAAPAIPDPDNLDDVA